ncbi:hypothetical protein GVAV_003170 [Gurleya vavrai]
MISKNKKLITISNSLNLNDNILFFQAYTPAEMKDIVKQKIIEESPELNIESNSLDIFVKKYGSNGDLRKVFEFLKNSLEKIENVNKENINLLDLDNFEKKEDLEINMHHKIIKGLIKEKNKNLQKKIYGIYIQKCKDLKIKHLNKSDFNICYEIYKK